MCKCSEIGVAVVGFGTVGAGVVETLQLNGGLLEQRLGVKLALRGVADLDVTTDRGVTVEPGVLTTDSAALVERDDVDVVVELIGGSTVAKALVEKALKRGKCVVTANKKLLAEYGAELYQLAAENNTALFYEAAVAGGIPIIKSLREGLCANRIESIYGILNGTCNYILTRMELEGLPFEVILKEAQELGYAEAEPSLDVDGHDTAHKAAVLASLAYGAPVALEQLRTEGIRGIQQEDIRCADRMGYRIKLLAIIKESNGEVEVGVQPTLIPKCHQLAAVSGVFNAVLVQGDRVGTTMFYGRGAGRAATSSAVVADIADAALAKLANRVSCSPVLMSSTPLAMKESGRIVERYYLRLSLLDKPGALATVAAVLGRHEIGIASVNQPEDVDQQSGDKKYAVVVVVTDRAPEAAMQAALDEISKIEDLLNMDPVKYRIEDFT